MSLSTEQKAFILKRLNSQLHSVDLKCDGYTVRLYLQRVQDLKLAIEVFVDGWVKGEWLTNPDEHPESKFFPCRYKYFYLMAVLFYIELLDSSCSCLYRTSRRHKCLKIMGSNKIFTSFYHFINI